MVIQAHPRDASNVAGPVAARAAGRRLAAPHAEKWESSTAQRQKLRPGCTGSCGYGSLSYVSCVCVLCIKQP